MFVALAGPVQPFQLRVDAIAEIGLGRDVRHGAANVRGAFV